MGLHGTAHYNPGAGAKYCTKQSTSVHSCSCNIVEALKHLTVVLQHQSNREKHPNRQQPSSIPLCLSFHRSHASCATRHLLMQHRGWHVVIAVPILHAREEVGDQHTNITRPTRAMQVCSSMSHHAPTNPCSRHTHAVAAIHHVPSLQSAETIKLHAVRCRQQLYMLKRQACNIVR